MNPARFVICVGSPQHVAPGSCYIAQDGSPTMLGANAARFNRFAQAKSFVEAHHIVLNARTYIGREEFADLDMCD